MKVSLLYSLAIAVVLAVTSASSAQAFIEQKHFDRYYGARALDQAKPGSGPLAPNEPDQVDLEEEFDFQWEGYTITAVQGFGIEALVLGRKDYSQGDMGALVPIDLALAWGKVSDPEWAKYLKVEQSERVYRWSYPRGTPLDTSTVETHSANMHMMPASPEILSKMSSVAKGDVVRLSGFLVDITRPAQGDDEGFSWLTSRVRTDTGLGACEVILVTSVEIEGR